MSGLDVLVAAATNHRDGLSTDSEILTTLSELSSSPDQWNPVTSEYDEANVPDGSEIETRPDTSNLESLFSAPNIPVSQLPSTPPSPTTGHEDNESGGVIGDVPTGNVPQSPILQSKYPEKSSSPSVPAVIRASPTFRTPQPNDPVEATRPCSPQNTRSWTGAWVATLEPVHPMSLSSPLPTTYPRAPSFPYYRDLPARYRKEAEQAEWDRARRREERRQETRRRMKKHRAAKNAYDRDYNKHTATLMFKPSPRDDVSKHYDTSGAKHLSHEEGREILMA